MPIDASTIWKTLGVLDLLGVVLFTFIAVSRKRDPAVTLAWVLGFSFCRAWACCFTCFRLPAIRPSAEGRPNLLHRLLLLRESAERFPGIPRPSNPHGNPGRDAHGFSRRRWQPAFGSTPDPRTPTTPSPAPFVRRATTSTCVITSSSRTAPGYGFATSSWSRPVEGPNAGCSWTPLGSYRIGKSFLRPLQDAGGERPTSTPSARSNGPGPSTRATTGNWRWSMARPGSWEARTSGTILAFRIAADQWRETDVRLEGPAAVELQTVFAEDWHFATGENLIGDAYFPVPRPRGTTRAQVVPTGPNKRENALGMIFVEAMHSARERVTITTPYFIPTAPMAWRYKRPPAKGPGRPFGATPLRPPRRRLGGPQLVQRALGQRDSHPRIQRRLYPFQGGDGGRPLGAPGVGQHGHPKLPHQFRIEPLAGRRGHRGHLEKQFDQMLRGRRDRQTRSAGRPVLTRQFWKDSAACCHPCCRNASALFSFFLEYRSINRRSSVVRAVDPPPEIFPATGPPPRRARESGSPPAPRARRRRPSATAAQRSRTPWRQSPFFMSKNPSPKPPPGARRSPPRTG